MPIADPVLMHVQDAASGQPTPVVWTAGALATLLDSFDPGAGSAQLYASGTCDTSGDNTLVAAPGSGYQIVAFKVLLQNLTNNATTGLLKWGSDEIGGAMFGSQYDRLVLDFVSPDRLSGGDNQPLLLNLSGANSFRFMVMYYVRTL
jgi:hypothetical protein